MAFVLKDRVFETSTTTGTGTYTLAGAKDGYQAFSAIGDGNTTYYVATDGTNWETGQGVYTASGTTLSRASILSSSNSGSAVSWGAGEKDIFCAVSEAKTVFEDDSNNVAVGSNITVGGTVDGRDLATDGAKLDGIEASATADQTDAEIKTAYENNADTNAFTDALLTKLNGIETSATADQSDSEIKTAYENNSDTNAFTDALQTKLNGIASSANNYVHPNHSGEVTSTADGATEIASNVVDEDNLKVSNTPTNGYFLSAQSGNTGGLTWAAVPAGYSDSDVDTHLNQSSASSGQYLQWNGSDYAWASVSSGNPFNQNLNTSDSPTFSSLTVSNNLSVSNNITCSNVVTAYTFNATSDATLKTNIAPIENPLAILGKITGVSFDWKDNEGSAEGVLAQDVEKVLPNAVLTNEDGKKSVSYNNLVGVLIEAVKGQQKQINELKEKLVGL
tara:strand:+ start:1455 stop:2798 length:1344 start_codon:yes stop_codon:yes gene_type:complete